MTIYVGPTHKTTVSLVSLLRIRLISCQNVVKIPKITEYIRKIAT